MSSKPFEYCPLDKTILNDYLNADDASIPLEETNVNLATEGESLLSPFSPSHSSPPPDRFLLSKNIEMASREVVLLKPLT